MDLIRRIASSRVAQGFVVIAALYWAIAYLVDFDAFRFILDSIIFALSLVMVGVYLPSAAEELVKDRVGRTGRLLISMVLIWTAMAALRGLSVYGRGFHQIADIGDTRIFGFILWIVMCAAVLGVAAPAGDDPAGSPFRYRNWIIVAIALGSAIGGFFIGLQWH